MPRVTERDVEILNPRRVLSGTPHSLHAAAPATLQRERRCGSRRCPVGRSVAHGGRESGTRSLRSRAGDHPRPRGGRRRARIESRRGRRLLPHRARHFRAQRAGVARAHGAHGRIRGDAEPRAVHRSRTGIERRLPARGGTTRENCETRLAICLRLHRHDSRATRCSCSTPHRRATPAATAWKTTRAARAVPQGSATREVLGGVAAAEPEVTSTPGSPSVRLRTGARWRWPRGGQPGVDRTLADHLEQRAETFARRWSVQWWLAHCRSPLLPASDSSRARLHDARAGESARSGPG